ncbi:MAG: DUF2854 domain-containing protein [Spirulinaceae cyanobacterium SM2_1_0]|nr:DUF2854 domain-containing protein [Spirulinaceae cyanobacterium SM2_1_0]
MIRNISLAQLGLIFGSVLTLMGIAAYASDKPTLNLIGFFYGVPLLLIGLALKAAELKPARYSQVPSADAIALREREATSTLEQVRKDVTRYRYGQRVHLQESLERLGLSPVDEECPVLESLRETAIDGHYALVLEFFSEYIPFSSWQERHERLEKFFGPGIRAELAQVDEDKVELSLIAAPAERVEAA